MLAFGFGDGVFEGVCGDFFGGGGENINPEIVGHNQYPVEHIREFLAYLVFVGFDVFFYLLLVLPLEMFQHLRSFQRQRHRQILRLVKLLPFSFPAERNQLLG